MSAQLSRPDRNRARRGEDTRWHRNHVFVCTHVDDVAGVVRYEAMRRRDYLRRYGAQAGPGNTAIVVEEWHITMPVEVKR